MLAYIQNPYYRPINQPYYCVFCEFKYTFFYNIIRTKNKIGVNKMHTVPFKLNCGIILVPAKVNEEDGHFAFDTGAMQTAINKAYFPEMTGEHIVIAKFSEGVKVKKNQ